AFVARIRVVYLQQLIITKWLGVRSTDHMVIGCSLLFCCLVLIDTVVNSPVFQVKIIVRESEAVTVAIAKCIVPAQGNSPSGFLEFMPVQQVIAPVVSIPFVLVI